MTGLSDDWGCWKIIAMRSPRTLRSSLPLERAQVATVEHDLPGSRCDRAWRDQSQDGQRRHALAAAGLADEAEDLAPADGEVDARDRTDHAIAV